MGFIDDVNRIAGAKQDQYSLIQEFGGTVSSTDRIDSYADIFRAMLEAGVDGTDVSYGYIDESGKFQELDLTTETPTISGSPVDATVTIFNTGVDEPLYKQSADIDIDFSGVNVTSSAMLNGFVAIGSNGKKVYGTIDTVRAYQQGDEVIVPVGYIQESQRFSVGSDINLGFITATSADILEGKVGSDANGNPVQGSIKSVTAYVSNDKIIVPVGYHPTEQTFEKGADVDLSQVTVTASDMLEGKVSIDASGNTITGTIKTIQLSSANNVNNNIVTIPSGYVKSSVTLTVGKAVAAYTITPGTADVVVPAGSYLTGNVTVIGDPNAVAGNIRKGATIFGIAGSYEGTEVVSDGVFYVAAAVNAAEGTWTGYRISSVNGKYSVAASPTTLTFTDTLPIPGRAFTADVSQEVTTLTAAGIKDLLSDIELSANNDSSGYIASASSENLDDWTGVGHYAYHAFNTNLNSMANDYWSTNGWDEITEETPAWVQLQFPKAEVIKKVSIANVWGNAELPIKFSILGSNNGSSWTTLRVVNDHPTTLATAVDYELDTDASYKYLRISITKSSSGYSVGIRSIRIFAEDTESTVFTPINELPGYSDVPVANRDVLLSDADKSTVITWSSVYDKHSEGVRERNSHVYRTSSGFAIRRWYINEYNVVSLMLISDDPSALSFDSYNAHSETIAAFSYPRDSRTWYCVVPAINSGYQYYSCSWPNEYAGIPLKSNDHISAAIEALDDFFSASSYHDQVASSMPLRMGSYGNDDWEILTNTLRDTALEEREKRDEDSYEAYSLFSPISSSNLLRGIDTYSSWSTYPIGEKPYIAWRSKHGPVDVASYWIGLYCNDGYRTRTHTKLLFQGSANGEDWVTLDEHTIGAVRANTNGCIAQMVSRSLKSVASYEYYRFFWDTQASQIGDNGKAFHADDAGVYPIPTTIVTYPKSHIVNDIGRGLVWHMPLTNNTTAATGQSVQTTGSITFATLQDMPAAVFNGSSYLTTPQQGLNLGAAFSMSCWCLLDASIADEYNIAASLTTGGEWDTSYAGIGYDKRSCVSRINGSNISWVGAIAAKKQWHHVCLTYCPGSVDLYVNGLKYDTTDSRMTTPLSIAKTGSAYIGAASEYGSVINIFKGAMTDFRMYNRRLNQQEVEELFSLHADKIKPYTGSLIVNEPLSGSPTSSLLPFQANGTIAKVVKSGISCSEFKPESYYSFSSEPLKLLETNPSMCFWMFMGNFAQSAGALASGLLGLGSLAGSYAYGNGAAYLMSRIVTLWKSSGLTELRWGYGASYDGTQAVDISDVPGRWAHVALVYDDVKLKVYIDGELRGVLPLYPRNEERTNYDAVIGNVGRSGGEVDVMYYAGFKIYDYPITEATIKGLLAEYNPLPDDTITGPWVVTGPNAILAEYESGETIVKKYSQPALCARWLQLGTGSYTANPENPEYCYVLVAPSSAGAVVDVPYVDNYDYYEFKARLFTGVTTYQGAHWKYAIYCAAKGGDYAVTPDIMSEYGRPAPLMLAGDLQYGELAEDVARELLDYYYKPQLQYFDIEFTKVDGSASTVFEGLQIEHRFDANSSPHLVISIHVPSPTSHGDFDIQATVTCSANSATAEIYNRRVSFSNGVTYPNQGVSPLHSLDWIEVRSIVKAEVDGKEVDILFDPEVTCEYSSYYIAKHDIRPAVGTKVRLYYVPRYSDGTSNN
jgi:hypothetical protein